MGKEKRVTIEDKEYLIVSLDGKAMLEGQKVYTKAFKTAIEDGAILKKSLEDHMRRQGLWDDDMQAEYEQMLKRSADLEYKIKSGYYKKASDLRDKGIELKRIRMELSELLMTRNSMDSITADGVADQARFEYFITQAVLDFLTRKPVFSSLADYKERESDPVTIKLASEYANFAYGLKDNYEDDLVENRLLRRLGLLNDKGQLINRNGKRVDIDGNLLDEHGGRIDANGDRIDINNNPVIDDEVVDTLEFIDDLSEEETTEEPVVVATETEEETVEELVVVAKKPRASAKPKKKAEAVE